MTRGRRIATGLGIVAGVLLALAIGLALGLGRSYSLRDSDNVEAPAAVAVELRAEAPKMPPASDYADILVRPLFNESRQPEALPDIAAAGQAQASAPLNVSLSGIVITNGVQIALVTNNATREVTRVRVGQPLEGDQAGWNLVELKPRGAVFEGAGLGRQEIELSTDTAGMAMATQPVAIQQPAPVAAMQAGSVPPPGAPPQAPAAMAQDVPVGAAATPPAVTPGAAASPTEEEIRKRIEERRRQLREEAQRLLQEQQKPPGG